MRNDYDDEDDKVQLVYNYFTAILNFEKKLEKLYKNYDWNETNNAYIVKLKEYQGFKDSIFYDILKENNNNESSCKKKLMNL